MRASLLIPVGISIFGFILSNSQYSASLFFSDPPQTGLYTIVIAVIFGIVAMIVSWYLYYSSKDRKFILIPIPFALFPIILRLYFMIVHGIEYPTILFNFI